MIACGDPSQEKKENKLTQLKWLEGTWENRQDSLFTSESWNVLNDSTFSCHGFAIMGKDTMFSETIMLEEKNGEVFYTPAVSTEGGQEDPVAFKLVADSGGVFIFENKTHDFPQRIAYSNPAPDSLYAWIEGMTDQGIQKEAFPARRKK